MKLIKIIKLISFYSIIIFLFLGCGNTEEMEKDYTYLPDIEDGKRKVEYEDFAYFGGKLWYVKFKNPEQIRLNDDQIFLANEIRYAKEKGTLLKLINNNGYPFILPNDEGNPRMIRDIFFNEDKTIHYAYDLTINRYKIYFSNGDTILAGKVSTHDNDNPKLRNEYKISEIKEIESNQKFRIPYPKPDGQKIEVTEIGFQYEILDYIRIVSGITLELPDGNNAKVNFISFYNSGNLKRVNLTNGQSIIINGKNVSEYIIYDENGIPILYK